MKDVNKVLREKELQLEQVRLEVESLKIVAPLLEEEKPEASKEKRWP
jgi:hypothetical protein